MPCLTLETACMLDESLDMPSGLVAPRLTRERDVWVLRSTLKGGGVEGLQTWFLTNANASLYLSSL